MEPGAREPIPVPGATYAAARLDQPYLEPRFAQPVQLLDAGYPGTDDDDVDVITWDVSLPGVFLSAKLAGVPV